MVVYMIGFISFIGWWFFILFAGTGLFAIPVDYINAYRNRPQKRTGKEILQKKEQLGQKVQELINMGQDIENAERDLQEAKGLLEKQKAQSKLNTMENNFKVTVLSVEKEFEIFSEEVNYGTYDPFKYKSYLWIGIILFIVAGLWWA